ncbi:hypothetical protein EDC94DRAFT_608601, partial [Helicostylum pulchrum]
MAIVLKTLISVDNNVTKHILFSLEEPTTAEDIQKEIPDATEKEVTTLPFCLIANDILHITGYTKFTRSLFPTPRPTKLQALEINVP